MLYLTSFLLMFFGVFSQAHMINSRGLPGPEWKPYELLMYKMLDLPVIAAGFLVISSLVKGNVL